METNQYFGVPLANIEAAQSHPVVGRRLLNVTVPSRKEVATLPPRELKRALFEWMNRSATEIIPSRAQIYEILAVLRLRKDFNEIGDVSEMCAAYILGD